MSKILVVDDEQGVCFAFSKFLKAEGHRPITCSTAENALTILENDQPNLVISDIRLPGMSGLELLERIKKLYPKIAVILITAHSTMKTAVDAMKSGAYEYIVKPIDLDEAKIHIDRALESQQMENELRMLRSELTRLYGEPPPLPDTQPSAAKPPVIIGNCARMQEVFKKIGSVSGTGVSVLLIGESGTGKDLVARAIHANSTRKDGPFEPINCAALPDTLLESELFGYEEGAFTGASRCKAGKFEMANGGTVFLDEIGDISLAAQAKLLRFLEDKMYSRLGGNERLMADVRIISATNSDLEKKMRAGEFREDLYYRLSVFTIQLPPLRQRRSDIPLLAAHFLEPHPSVTIVKDTITMLEKYSWPGNVRELRNAIEHALVLARGKTILPDHLPMSVRSNRKAPEADGDRIPETLAVAMLEANIKDASLHGKIYEEMMDAWERPIIEHAIELYGGNQVQIARVLGLHRTTLRKKMLKYGLL